MGGGGGLAGGQSKLKKICNSSHVHNLAMLFKIYKKKFNREKKWSLFGLSQSVGCFFQNVPHLDVEFVWIVKDFQKNPQRLFYIGLDFFLFIRRKKKTALFKNCLESSCTFTIILKHELLRIKNEFTSCESEK